MDFSKFKTPDWLMIGGAIGFFIFGTFVSWATAGGESAGNAFDWFFRGAIPWILVIGTGVIAFLLAGGMIKRGGAPWPLILLAATGLATLLLLLLLITGPDQDGFDLGRGAGLWLSFVSAVVALAGAVMYYTASGGSLGDLTDRDKLRSSFGQRGDDAMQPPPPPPMETPRARDAPPMDTPPPPPPPGGTAPPPPPPVP